MLDLPKDVGNRFKEIPHLTMQLGQADSLPPLVTFRLRERLIRHSGLADRRSKLGLTYTNWGIGGFRLEEFESTYYDLCPFTVVARNRWSRIDCLGNTCVANWRIPTIHLLDIARTIAL
jgi:hypothetical protein